METALRALTYVLCVAVMAGAVFAVIGGAVQYWSRPLADEREAPPTERGRYPLEEIDQPTAPIYGRDFT